MSKRTNTSTKPMNPSGFLFTIKHKATPSSNGMSMSKIDLSKPIIKIKAKLPNTLMKLILLLY